MQAHRLTLLAPYPYEARYRTCRHGLSRGDAAARSRLVSIRRGLCGLVSSVSILFFSRSRVQLGWATLTGAPANRTAQRDCFFPFSRASGRTWGFGVLVPSQFQLPVPIPSFQPTLHEI